MGTDRGGATEALSPNAAAVRERDRQQMLEFQASNHTLAMELTAMHAVDQGQRDLFPPAWEDHRDFEADAIIDSRGATGGSYTDMRVDGRPSNVAWYYSSVEEYSDHGESRDWWRRCSDRAERGGRQETVTVPPQVCVSRNFEPRHHRL